MKRLLATLTSIFSLLALALAPGIANADTSNTVCSPDPDWCLTASTPASLQSSNNFVVQYSILSTKDSTLANPDSFTVDLYQDESSTISQTQNTATDPNGINGNSGSFSVTEADGHHSFQIKATRDNGGDTKTANISVDVDATAPAAPTYNGKTRSGNTYTVNFTAPTTSDVTQVRVYSSTSLSFTANSATQVGVVSVSPGQTTSFTYTAPDSTERFNAVRAFDAAGNGSAAVGDSNTVVTTTIVQGTATNAATNAAGQATTGVAATGAVLGASTTTPAQATTGTSSTSTTKPNSSAKKGSVLGVTTVKKPGNKYIWPALFIGAVLIAFAIYHYRPLTKRRGDNP